ncbi:5284_t:CDS:2 [Racocetra fulgida]|uniref:5284_t:CDS:1 n=1 Tax=Racocetra fulgida TaxID=60492 RepID=A0A9N8ZIR5_9GLOM|nr:5284_t:CDS:2 [Racocetra fulgida]
MATKAAYKRLTKEYLAVQKKRTFLNGNHQYGLNLGLDRRFQPDTRLCLSMSDFHPSTWNPSWSVATILTGLLSFMTSNEATTGSIKTTDADKKIYAARSHQFNLNDPKFREYFPELCIPEAVPVEILYPMSSSSSTSTQTSTDATKSANHVPPAQQRNDHGTVNQRLIPAARNQNLQRKVLNRVENPTIRGHTEHANNTARVNANNPQTNNNNNNLNYYTDPNQSLEVMVKLLECDFFINSNDHSNGEK